MEKGQLKIVELAKVKDDRFPMRQLRDDAKFKELVDNVRLMGVLVPVILKQDGDFYFVVAGHRRTAAAKIAGITEYPANVFSEDQDIGLNAAFAENMFREDLTAIEEAAAVFDALEQGQYDVDGLAKVLGKSRNWIDQRCEMVEWPQEVQLAVHLGKLSTAAARNLALVENAENRAMLVDHAVENGATARITAAWLQAARSERLPEDLSEVEPEPLGQALPPLTPHTPCVLCSGMIPMGELRYLPICTHCQPIIIQVAQSMREDAKQPLP